MEPEYGMLIYFNPQASKRPKLGLSKHKNVYLSYIDLIAKVYLIFKYTFWIGWIFGC